MIFAIHSFRSYLPSLPSFASPKQMAANVTKVAIPALILYASTYASQPAEAGPLAYAACMAACTGATMGGFIPACMAACAPALAAPTP